ncbi:MAG: non-ribosomal peptide synthetase, partial [Symploca sp. SIO2E6]|nr:non-ribosomal peptide synthetase [Symploca sp. SIO2E6]
FGRIDNQVKIRGFRIELGEIEATLAQYPEVQEVVVIAREDSGREKCLVAYLVTQEELASTQLRSFLKNKLPDYMIPTAFVLLDAIPLTPNGKVNRRALPTPDADHFSQDTSLIPPRNPLELQLSQIWSEVLNIPTLGVRNSFFDLGGHSLLAVRLMARIEQQLGIHLPLTTLFTEPTIENQAHLLNSRSDISSNSPLVPIQTSGKLPPLFCIHPIGGNVLSYAELAESLGKNQPFYGLQSVGLYGNEEPLTNIEEMAATYIQALQEIQPHSPYYLAGWSMGGVVAWEMAQQLQAAGQEVALVALIDSYAPSTISELETDETSLVNSLAADLGGLFGTELPLAQLNLEQLQPEEQLQHIFTAAKRLNLLPPEVGIEQMRYLFQVFQANRIAIANYQPQPYSGKVVLFCASSSVEDRGWSSLITGELETHTIPGDHYTMMRSSQVQVLAQQLETYLNQK